MKGNEAFEIEIESGSTTRGRESWPSKYTYQGARTPARAELNSWHPNSCRHTCSAAQACLYLTSGETGEFRARETRLMDDRDSFLCIFTVLEIEEEGKKGLNTFLPSRW